MVNWNLHSARSFQFYGRRREIIFLSDFRCHGFRNLNLARSQTVTVLVLRDSIFVWIETLIWLDNNLVLFEE